MKAKLKKYVPHVIIGMWVLAGIQFVYNHKEAKRNETNIVEAFAGVQMNNQESLVESVGRCTASYVELDKRQAYIIDLANKLGIKSGYEIESKYEMPRSEVKLTKEAKKAATTIQFITMEEGIENNMVQMNQYLVVRIEMKDDLNSALQYKGIVDNIMSANTENANTTINLKGSYNGNLNLEQRNKVSEQLLKTMSAKVVSEHRELDLYTIYGYTDYIEEVKTVQDEKINLNIAIHYDEGKDKTFVYFASPIVGFDY
jgi:hypothetical protein